MTKRIEQDYDKVLGDIEMEKYLDEKKSRHDDEDGKGENNDKYYTDLEDGSKMATKFLCGECGTCIASQDMEDGQFKCNYCGRIVDVVIL